MIKKMKSISVLFVATLLFVACSKNDPEIPNEEELITTLNYTLTSSSGNTVLLSFVDLDGDGGTDPVITGGTLVANETYTGVLTLLNESETPVESITEEIEEEAEEHQFFFESSVTGLSIAYTDEDSNGNPIGLESTLTTGAANTGSITIILKHEPNKPASDAASAGGETDIEVIFAISVE